MAADRGESGPRFPETPQAQESLSLPFAVAVPVLRRFPGWVLGGWLAAAWALLPGYAPAQQRPDAAYYTLQNKHFGLTVRVPQAWRPVALGQGDRVFVLRVPQHRGSPTGYVSCRVSVWTVGLQELARRYRQQHPGNKTAWPRLLKLEQKPLDPEQVGLEQAEAAPGMLVTLWEHRTEEGTPHFEKRIELPQGELLFRFRLQSDEAHFFAYEPEFEELVGSVRFGLPKLDLRRDAQGRWHHRRFGFSLAVPQRWQVVPGPHAGQLFLAVGPRGGAVRDRLSVMAAPKRGLDLDQLARRLPQLISRQDQGAEVEVARIRQGDRPALEVVIRTRRDGVAVVIVQRQVPGERFHFQLTLTCRAETFRQHRRELMEALASFRDEAGDP